MEPLIGILNDNKAYSFPQRQQQRNNITISLTLVAKFTNNLPHANMIEKVGKFICHLSLSDFTLRRDHMMKKAEQLHLDYLLHLGPLLKSLTIKNSSSAIKCNPRKSKRRTPFFFGDIRTNFV